MKKKKKKKTKKKKKKKKKHSATAQNYVMIKSNIWNSKTCKGKLQPLLAGM